VIILLVFCGVLLSPFFSSQKVSRLKVVLVFSRFKEKSRLWKTLFLSFSLSLSPKVFFSRFKRERDIGIALLEDDQTTNAFVWSARRHDNAIIVSPLLSRGKKKKKTNLILVSLWVEIF